MPDLSEPKRRLAAVGWRFSRDLWRALDVPDTTFVVSPLRAWDALLQVRERTVGAVADDVRSVTGTGAYGAIEALRAPWARWCCRVVLQPEPSDPARALAVRGAGSVVIGVGGLLAPDDSLPFHVAAGRDVDAPALRGTVHAWRRDLPGGTSWSIALSLRDVLVLVVPDEGDALPALERELPSLVDPRQLRGATTTIDLTVPRLEVDSDQDLQPAARRLGLGALFDGHPVCVPGDAAPCMHLTRFTVSASLRLDPDVAAEVPVLARAEAATARVVVDRPFAFALTSTDGPVIVAGHVIDPT